MQLAAPVPSNLRLKGAQLVESDVFNVCQRIREIDPNLYVVLQEGQPKPWVVMEMCRDGECRLVSRYEELDARIIDDLRRMLAIPFQQRIDELQKQADWENDYAARARESEAWEHFVWDFNRELHRCNFVDRKWFKSTRPIVKR